MMNPGLGHEGAAPAAGPISQKVWVVHSIPKKGSTPLRPFVACTLTFACRRRKVAPRPNPVLIPVKAARRHARHHGRRMNGETGLVKLLTVRPAEIERIPDNLLREPVEFLFADHYRQRVVCDLLERLVLASADTGAADSALRISRYLNQELPLHMADERLDLLPVLAARVGAEDSAGVMSSRVTNGHRDDGALADRVLAALDAIIEGRRQTDPTGFMLAVASFVESLRRHIFYENGVVLPLARQMLSETDLSAIGRRMATRRKIPYPD